MSASTLASNKLCDKCSNIIVYIPRRTQRYGDFHGSRQLLREYHSLADLMAGADFGCAFCILVHACHERSAGQAIACSPLRVYRVIRDDLINTCFLKLECDHAYGKHSEQSLGVLLNEEGTM